MGPDASAGTRTASLRLKLPRAATPPSTPPSTTTPDPLINPDSADPAAYSYNPPPPGLFNLGNTCYLNSVVQVLYHMPDFRRTILTHTPGQSADPFAAELTHALRHVFTLLDDAHAAARTASNNPDEQVLDGSAPKEPLTDANGDLILRDGIDYIAPQDIINLLRDQDRCVEFDARGQQDAHEFLRFLLDKVNDCLQYPDNSSAQSNGHRTNGLSSCSIADPDPSLPLRHVCISKEGSPVAKRRRREAGDDSRYAAQAYRKDLIPLLFQGKAVTATRCSECESRTERAECFLDVSLPVEAGKTLSWALSSQGAAETLLGTNKYACSFCNTYMEAKRWWQMAQLPPVLTVHLKLFAFGARRAGGGKVSVAMPCPLRMRLREWCTPDCQERDDEYRLTAVIVHEGTAASSGHYYSYIFLEEEQQWYCFDDSYVSSVSEVEMRERLFTSVKSRRTAYLLFYTHERRDLIETREA